MQKVSFANRYHGLDEDEKKIVMMRLKGATYKRIYAYVDRKKLLMKKINVRRLIDTVLHNAVSYIEDKYTKIYRMFEWDVKSFCRVFGESKLVYLYLDYKTNKGIFGVPNYFKYIGDGKGFKYKGVGFKFNPNSFIHIHLLDAFLENSKKTFTAEDFIQKCNTFSKTVNLLDLKHVLRTNRNIIEVKEGMYRFYDNRKLELRLKSFEKSILCKNGLYSIDRIYDIDKGLYLDLGIQSSIGLYDITNKYKSYFQSDKIVKILRYPYILFGYKNKKEYFNYLIKKYHNLPIDVVVNSLYVNYGIDKGYLINNLKGINKDKVNKEGIIRNITISFTDRQIGILKKRLIKEYYQAEDFLNILRKVKSNIPDRILDSDEMERLGYKKEYNYIIHASIFDIKKHIENKICSKDFIRLNLNEEVDSLRRGIIESLIRNYKLIRISDDELITVKKLRSIYLYKKDILAFFKEIERRVGKDGYFTIEQLFDLGSFDLIENNSFDYRFYEELIKANNRFDCIQIDGEKLYCFTKNRVNRKTFIKKYLDRVKEQINVLDLTESIKNEYKIIVSHKTVKILAEDLGYYYNDTFEKIYKNKSIFLREVFDNEYVD